MDYSGVEVPGILSPDENIEHFAKLYGNDSLGMMLMASTIGNSGDLPGKPRFNESDTSEYLPSTKRPTYDDQSFQTSFRNGLQTSCESRTMRHGKHYNPPPAMEAHYPRYSHHKKCFEFLGASQASRSIRHRGYGDHYCLPTAMEHRNPRSSQQQNGFAPPSTSLGSRSMRHGSFGDHYHRQQERQFPPLPRYAWL
ncbi:uncharacterized protein LOC110187882 [Drosophila serrata]|uniref:uncharacterized protein LOC110187882 n=1 Tax=Drosophila serrata TaxID=7274 RepID=UPI000A1D128A|nr:uncharacterized protein LOC110187882 [Drosophila serrata]